MSQQLSQSQNCTAGHPVTHSLGPAQDKAGSSAMRADHHRGGHRIQAGPGPRRDGGVRWQCQCARNKYLQSMYQHSAGSTWAVAADDSHMSGQQTQDVL